MYPGARNRGMGRSRVAAFNPASLFAAGEQGFWYDPSDLSTQFQDSAGTTPVTAAGQSVGKILDKSGKGNHLVQATAASRPTLQRDASGFWHWVFDGADDSVASAAVLDFTSTDKMAVFAGVYKASDAARGIVYELGNSATGAFVLNAPNSPGVNAYVFATGGSLGGPGQASVVGATWAAPHAGVISCTGDIAGDSATIRVNAVAGTPGVADQGTGNYRSDTLYIGRRGGSTLPFNGRIYQLIGRGAATDAGIVAKVERFVGARMGLAP